MDGLRSEQIKAILWLVIIGSWVLGVVAARWAGVDGGFLELSKAVRVPNPSRMGLWWEVIAYFTLTTVSAFVLSHIFFGIGGGIFLFARGVYDNTLLVYLETTISGWSILSIPISEILRVLIVILILTVNLPLCLWSGQLGIQRSIYTLDRLRGKPVNPEFGSEPLTKLLVIVSASLVTGFIAAVVFSHL